MVFLSLSWTGSVTIKIDHPNASSWESIISNRASSNHKGMLISCAGKKHENSSHCDQDQTTITK